MPDINWEEIDTIQHEIKGTLTKTAGIESQCKQCSEKVKSYCSQIREEVKDQLEKLNEIILRQPTKEENDGNNIISNSK